MKVDIPNKEPKVVVAADSSFARLIGQVRSGDEEAARRLYDEYGNHILRAVRQRLHQRLRSKFDSLHFAQDVWASFFSDNAERFEVTTPAQLATLLTTMARNKVADAVRVRMMGGKHNVNRERSLEVPGEVRAQQPTPSQIMMGEENWDRILAGQPPVYRRVLLLLRRGEPPETIAQELGISLRTVQRVIRKVAL